MTEEDPIPIPAPCYEGDFPLNETLRSNRRDARQPHAPLRRLRRAQRRARQRRPRLPRPLRLCAGRRRGGRSSSCPASTACSTSTRDCVIGINIFGSCYGSTGPGSIDPATGKPYGPTFPLIGIRDIVRAQVKLIDHLGIDRLKLAIGASIGGMQVLEWAILFPERVARAVSIGVAPLGAMGLGLNHLQRQAIMLDPAWQGGLYQPGHGPTGGLALARALGMISYKSVPLLEERFARKPNRYGDENPYLSTSAGQNGRFDVAGYLDYQGATSSPRFDANSYISITRTMDIFDPVRAHETPYVAYAHHRAPHPGRHLHRLALPARRRPLARRHHPRRGHPLRLPRDGLQPRPRRLPRRTRPAGPAADARLRVAAGSMTKRDRVRVLAGALSFLFLLRDVSAGRPKPAHPYRYSIVDMPVSLAIGTIHTSEFAPATHGYWIMIQVEKPLSFDQMRCMMGVVSGPLDLKYCTNDGPLLRADWTVLEDGQVVKSGSSSTHGDDMYTKDYIFKFLGDFPAEAGKKYVVEVKFTKDGTPLNVANPHLIIVELGKE